AKIVENGVEQLLLGLLEIALGLVLKNSENVDHVFGGTQIALHATARGILDLSEMQQRLGAEPEQEAREADHLFGCRGSLAGRRRLGLRCRGSLGLAAGRVLLLSRLAVVGEAAPIGYPEPSRRIVLIDHDQFPGDASAETIELPAACPSALPNRCHRVRSAGRAASTL